MKNGTAARAMGWKPPAEDAPIFHLDRIPVEQLITENPHLHEPVVDGWFRLCEIVNVIAHPKFGKSWFVLYMAFCVGMGWELFGRFPVKRGRVLIIDLELHKSLIASRIKTVAYALGLTIEDYRESIDVVSLRGNWHSIDELLTAALNIAPGEYVLIIVDSKYRLGTGKTDENSNGDETQFYNRADRMGEITGAAIVFIHHATKGDQSGKRATDIGAGGGAQSRAADTHLVLREHEDLGVAVIEGAVRSFPPPEPLAIRWAYPLWVADEWADPAKLKGRLPASVERQNAKDKEGFDLIIKALMESPGTARQLRPRTAISKDRLQRLLDKLDFDGQIEKQEIENYGNKCVEYFIPEEGVGGD